MTLTFKQAVEIYGSLPVELGLYINDIIESDRRWNLKQKMKKAGDILEQTFIRYPSFNDLGDSYKTNSNIHINYVDGNMMTDGEIFDFIDLWITQPNSYITKGFSWNNNNEYTTGHIIDEYISITDEAFENKNELIEELDTISNPSRLFNNK